MLLQDLVDIMGAGRGRRHRRRQQREPGAMVFPGTSRAMDRHNRGEPACRPHPPARGFVRARERLFRTRRRGDCGAFELALGAERCSASERYPELARLRANAGVGPRRHGAGGTGRAARQAMGRNRARGTAADRTRVGVGVDRGGTRRPQVAHSAIRAAAGWSNGADRPRSHEHRCPVSGARLAGAAQRIEGAGLSARECLGRSYSVDFHLPRRRHRVARGAGRAPFDRSVEAPDAVGRNEAERIEVPSGRDEVAQLAAAFAKVLNALHQERSELLSLSSELERRVAVRTREVERLAEESRYAAVVRERLKIARDLHDTLAHSMMAMLSEVRLLRKLEMHDLKSLREELARAEEVAHEGLNEARTAITQMRVNAVRDTGLGSALGKAFGRFIADPGAASFGDERAETLFRMAEEALRNIERHAMATRAVVTLETVDGTQLKLSIEDDGVGFDPGAPRQGHYGIVGLHEQAHLIGAHLCIDSAPGRGTTLTVNLRMTPEML